MNLFRLFETVWGELKAAIRFHRRSPGFSALAIVTLSGGFCAAAVLFSLVHSIIWRPLSYPNGDRLAIVWDRDLEPRTAATMLRSAAAANYADWKAENHVFAALGAARSGRALLQDADGSENLTTARVSADLLQVLGAEPLLGRWLLPEEDIAGNERVVVLSHGLWRSRFGGDRAILDRPIRLDDQPHRVIGVMPQGFVFPPAMRLPTGSALQPGDVWLPLGRPTSASPRDSRNLRVFGLLAPGVTFERADAELNVIAERLRRQYPATNLQSAVRVVSLHEQIVAPIRPTLWMLMAGVGLLVILTCANLSSLLVARLVTRSREMATRLALGAGRRQLIQQLMTENILLALLSSAIGLAAASWILIALPNLLPANFPRLADVHLSGFLVIFLLLGSIVSGILIAGAPVFLMRRLEAQAVLAEGGRSSFGGVRQARLRGLMISSQMAIAVTLLIGGALLIKSLRQLQGVDPGFDTGNLLVMQLSVPQSAYPTPDALQVLYPQLQERVAALPGVRSVATTVNVPFGQTRTGWNIDVEGSAVDRNQPPPSAGFHNVSRSYFRTMAIALQRGRSFNATDTPRPRSRRS
jgi:putative ABC transport system permease protein